MRRKGVRPFLLLLYVRMSKLHSVSAVSVRAAKTAYPLAHSSFPNRTRCAGLRFGDAGDRPTAFRFPPGEESFIFVGSFLPFNRKPTSLGFAVGIRGNGSQRLPFPRGAGAQRLRGSFPSTASQKSRRGGHWPSAFFRGIPCGRAMHAPTGALHPPITHEQAEYYGKHHKVH